MIDTVPWLAASRWPTVPIKRVAKLGTGHTPSRHEPSYWQDCTIPWITLADVWQLRDGRARVIRDTSEKISALGLSNSAAVLHPAGSVILSRTASVGFSAILAADMATSQDFAVWTCGSQILPEFLLHVLRAMEPDLKRLAAGSTHKTIYMPDIQELRTPLPSVPEQRRIAAFLDSETARVDRLVEVRNRQIATAEERRIEVARQFTTLGTDRSTASRATGIAWMPKINANWSLHKVSRVFRTGSGTTPPSAARQYYDGRVPWVNTGDLRDRLLTEVQKTVTDVALEDYSTLRIYQPGALIVAMYGATIGRLGVLNLPAAVNQACCVLYDPQVVSTSFAFYWFLGHRSEVVALAEGGGQPNISQDILRSLRLPAPEPTDQRAITAAIEHEVDQGMSMIGLIEAQKVLLAERRQTLISAAVTGQLDVTTARGVA